MAIATRHFERIAEVVAERTSDLLDVPAVVVDAWSNVVAASAPDMIGARFEVPRGEEDRFTRVPLRLDSDSGEVIICHDAAAEVVSPRVAHALIELTINQTAVVDRLPNQHQLKNKFIHDLLHRTMTDEAATVREAQILGMDLTEPRAIILIDAAEYILAPATRGSDPDARIRRRAQMVVGIVVDFFHLPNDTICAYIGEGEVAVLKASNRHNMAPWVDSDDLDPGTSQSWAHLSALKRSADALLTRLRSDTRSTINIGVGRYHPGIGGLASSYQDARAALSLGTRFRGQNRVHCLDGLGIPAFIGVADQGTKIDLATYLLSPLDHEAELLRTLEVFFTQNCCPSEAARLLNIHRNTLSYRLDKIASLTGLDPRCFDDAVQIRLALALRSL